MEMTEEAEIAQRREVEREICQAVVTDALAAGYGLSLQADGEEFEAPTLDGEAIIATLMDVDEAYLVVHRQPLPATTLGTDSVGYVYFVFGNDDGTTVISDYTVNLNALISRAESIANRRGGGISDGGPRPWMLEADPPDHLATEAEADREYARNVGAMRPNDAWILSDRDVWYQNPSYSGPPVPHPESDDWMRLGGDCTPYGSVAMTAERIVALAMSQSLAVDIIAEMVLEAGDPSRRTAEAETPVLTLTREAAGALAVVSLTHPGESVLPVRPYGEAVAYVEEIALLAQMFARGVQSLAPASGGTTTGPVVDLTDHHLIQDVGRGKAIYHARDLLFREPHFDGVAYASPGRGTNVRISYDAAGQGTLERLPLHDHAKEVDRG